MDLQAEDRDRPHPVAAITAYMLLNISVAALAFVTRDWDAAPSRFPVRWLSGVACLTLLSMFKMVALMPVVQGIGLLPSILLYATTALWECSNGSLVLDGRAALQHFRITSLRRALVKGLVPCQVIFAEEICSGDTHADAQGGAPLWRRCALLAASLLAGAALRAGLRASRSLLALVESWPILEAEALAWLSLALVLLLDIPAAACQLALDCLLAATGAHAFRARVIFPYALGLWAVGSSRDFWRKFSRPAGAVNRTLWYRPLGGGARPWLAIPVMFAANANAHFAVGQALVGDAAPLAWLTLFGITGGVLTAEVLADARAAAQGAPAPLRWYVLARALVAHATMCAAAYIMVRGCLRGTLAALVM
jgi:hypothetical protein